MPVRDQRGHDHKDEGKLRFWKKHFKRVLNRDDPETTHQNYLIYAEMLKADEQNTPILLTDILRDVLENRP